MRILLVSSYLPYPLYSGGHIRLYNLIKVLSKNHKITLVCEKREYQTVEDIKELKKYCEQVITIERRKQWSLQNILLSLFGKYPFLLVGHTSPDMKKAIVGQLNEKQFDVIHVETFYVFQNLPKTYLPIVLAEHNIEYLVYERYVRTKQFFLQPFLMIDVMKIKYWEEAFWKRVTRLIAVSEIEKTKMGISDVSVIANGVNLEEYKMKSLSQKLKRKEKRILFIGDFKWIQNVQALTTILEEIWPKILQLGREKKIAYPLKLWVVGKNIPGHFKEQKNSTVEFDEHAPEETWKIYQQADVLLAPIRVGGGTSYKILESMATGLPVVTTRLGIEGIGAIEGKEVLLGETGEELAKHVIQLLENKEFYENVTLHARSLIEKNFDWQVISRMLEKVYESTRKQL